MSGTAGVTAGGRWTCASPTSRADGRKAAAVSAIRAYRANVYTYIPGLGASREVLRPMQEKDGRSSPNILVTGTYLNDRNEKVFSVFQEVYQANQEREYFLEICLYETELFRYFNKETRENIYLFYGGALNSMSDRAAFRSMLHSKAEQGGGTISREEAEIAQAAVVISDQGAHGLYVLVETDVSHLEEGYVTLLWRMLPFFLAMFVLAFFFATLLTNQMNFRLKILQEKIAAVSDWELAQPLHIDSGGRSGGDQKKDPRTDRTEHGRPATNAGGGDERVARPDQLPLSIQLAVLH